VKAAIIMAGGRSSRMRQSNGPQHKALVTVQGRTLLEHNVRQLLSEGFLNIFIAVNVRETELRACIDWSAASAVEEAGGELSVIVEERGLGTVGGARLAVVDGPLLVVNVDNLTDLGLSDLVRFHQDQNADLTIASHIERFRVPFCQLVVGDDDTITEYREKPEMPVCVSSGTYVLSSEAREAIPSGRPFDITDLFAKLNKDRMRFRTIAFRHNCRWIDVNDRTQLDRADQMFARRDQDETFRLQ
jgi:NDP-sugar pyrophosphorylase family protein